MAKRQGRQALLMALAVPLLSLFLASAAYSVLLSLDSSSIAPVAGSGKVQVNCPANSCSVSSVTWTISSSAPYKVTGAQIKWTPASADASVSYTVYVTVYDNTNQVIAYGSAIQAGSGSQVTTSITFNTAVSADKIYYVEVVIA